MRPLPTTILAGAASGCLLVGLGLPADAEGLGGADGVRYVRSVATIPAATTQPTSARAVARCAKGWTSVGGGHTIRGGSGRGIAAGLKIDARRWLAQAWQVDSDATSLTSYAVCLRRVNVVEEDATEYELPAGPSTLTQSGSCPGGRVVSGGVTYYGAAASEVTLSSSYPVDDDSDEDTVPDDGWAGRVHYAGDGGDSVSVYLVCLTGERPAYRKTSIAVPARKTVRTRAFCPPGRPVLGGGLRATGAGTASHVVASRPVDSRDAGVVPDDGWLGGVTNTSDQELTLSVYAVCR